MFKVNDRVILANRAYLGTGTIMGVSKEGILVLWDRRETPTPILYPEKSIQCLK